MPDSPATRAGAPRAGAFHTDDIDVAVDRIARLFGPHRIRPLGRERGLRFEHAHAWVGSVCFNRLAYGRHLRNHIQEFPDPSYCVMFPLHGHYAIEADGRRVDADLATITVINPTRPVTLEATPEYANLSVRITRAAVEHALATHTGTRPTLPVCFDPHPQPLRPEAAPLRNLVLQIWRDCAEQAAHATVDVVGREVEQLLASLLLRGVRHNFSHLLQSGPPVAGVAESVADYLRARVAEPVRLADVLAFARVGHTALYAAFQRRYGTTPMEYLREERLRLARERLTSPRARRASVARIALDCGFAHVSRFAACYRARYGEQPSETLARTLADAGTKAPAQP